MFNSFSKQFFGQPNEPFYPLDQFGQVDVVAVTHLHSDHFDPEAIKAAWGDEVSVLVPHEAVQTAKKAGLKQEPICLTPEQAVAAASLLGVKTLVPIHYGSFHNPPAYSQTPDLIERLQTSATDRNIVLRLLQHKESM